MLAKRVASRMVRSIFFQRLVMSLLSVMSSSFAAANLDSLAASDSANRSSARVCVLLEVRSVICGLPLCRKDLCKFVLQFLAGVSVAGLRGVCKFCIVW